MSKIITDEIVETAAKASAGPNWFSHEVRTRAALEAVAPMIVERCAEVAGYHMSGARATNKEFLWGYNAGRQDAGEGVRALATGGRDGE